MNPLLSRRRLLGAAALSGAAAVVLSACGNGGGGSGGDGSPVTAFSVEPENPLIPTATSEQGGGRIVSLVFMGLISYDDNSEPVNELAESIESDDNKTWTIKIKEGKKFTNGEDITAQSFVDAWNYGAAAKNAHTGSYFFEPVLGYDAVSAEGSEEDQMEGLTVVDDTTFTVELADGDVTFPIRLGYAAYSPLPASAFDDMEAFGENPVGWGPFKMDGEGAWSHNEEIRLVKNEDYDGSQPAQVDALTFKLYQSAEGAYSDLISDNLDILDQIPPSSMDVREDDLSGRTEQQDYAGNYSFAIPYYLDGWSGEAGKLRRQAISMSINRQELIDQVIKQGVPAKDLTSPAVEGFPDSFTNEEFVQYDPEKAKELWQQAEDMEAYPGGPFELAYNADGGHQEWVDAVCNMIKNTLDIEAQGKSYATFKELRTEANAGDLTSAIRSGWMADYPSMSNFLGSNFASNGSSNDTKFDNQEFDTLLSEGRQADDIDAANEKFIEADEILLEELPSIPLYYPARTWGWSSNVTDVGIMWNGEINYAQVTSA
ncbi:peptide ABC transporter substrate-binding protein [Kocuria sp.]|uniref:peptide ABC transporter substrate-binding protein n=1 Tax=Kocuria sp. TaxID=1871328 RepID=UPI0026E0E575|nr:ABC transporter substrate-binding protein [Kocuria sp.]MDO5617205.1 ABC transporter substrate-binding protein [Kocuria sp.]